MEGDNVDEDFLSLIAAAETQALDNKRRKIIHGGTKPEEQAGSNPTSEGAYTAALKGSKSLAWQQQQQQSSAASLKTRSNNSSVVVVSDTGGDTCFKCGKLGHWARDCVSSGGSGGLGFGGNEKTVDEKMCSCGLGVCLVLTANTEKNPGRKFYRCPARQENGGCGFFEWCDNSSATPASRGAQGFASNAPQYSAPNASQYSASNVPQYSTPNSSFPDVPCPCGAGLCLILTARTEKNMGQQFYRCPANQESSCGFFKWCNDRNSTVGSQTNTPKTFSNMNNSSNKSSGESRGNSCFKCGQDGHWSRDCPESAPASSVDVGGKTASSGTCYKCGMTGHWARDCPKPSSASSVGVVGKSASSGTCYKCSKSGHWAKDCPGEGRKVGQWR